VLLRVSAVQSSQRGLLENTGVSKAAINNKPSTISKSEVEAINDLYSVQKLFSKNEHHSTLSQKESGNGQVSNISTAILPFNVYPSTYFSPKVPAILS
jgi:hypothetical protein